MIYSPKKILNCYKFTITQKHDYSYIKENSGDKHARAITSQPFYLNLSMRKKSWGLIKKNKNTTLIAIRGQNLITLINIFYWLFKICCVFYIFSELGGKRNLKPSVSQLFISFESQCLFLDAVGIMGLANLAPNFFSNFDVARQLHII